MFEIISTHEIDLISSKYQSYDVYYYETVPLCLTRNFVSCCPTILTREDARLFCYQKVHAGSFKPETYFRHNAFSKFCIFVTIFSARVLIISLYLPFLFHLVI